AKYCVPTLKVKISVAWGTPMVRLKMHGGCARPGVDMPAASIHACPRAPLPPTRGGFPGPVGAAGRIVKPVEKRSLSSPAGLLVLKWFLSPIISALKSCAEKVKLLVALSQRIHWL